MEFMIRLQLGKHVPSKPGSLRERLLSIAREATFASSIAAPVVGGILQLHWRDGVPAWLVTFYMVILVLGAVGHWDKRRTTIQLIRRGAILGQGSCGRALHGR